MSLTSFKQVNKAGDQRGLHPHSLMNLHEKGTWVKGQSGNSVGWSLTSELKHTLSAKVRRKELVESTLQGAILREPTPFREVWDRVEGKLKDTGDVNVESRVLNIIVMDQHTADLLARVGERAKKLAIGEDISGHSDH